MKHFVLALSVLSVLTLSSAPLASAQVDDGTLHAGAPEDAKGVDKGTDKGKPPVTRPPTVPKSGPESLALLALVGGAGYLTYRRAVRQ